MSLGNKIRAARKRRRLTSKEISRLIGISRSAYNAYETDKKPIPEDILVKICSIMETTPEALCRETEKPPMPSEIIKAQALLTEMQNSLENIRSMLKFWQESVNAGTITEKDIQWMANLRNTLTSCITKKWTEKA